MDFEYESRVGQLLDKGFNFKNQKDRKKVIGFHVASIKDMIYFCKTGIIYTQNNKPFYVVPESDLPIHKNGVDLAKLIASYPSQNEGNAVLSIRDPAYGTLSAPTLTLEKDDKGTFVTFSKFNHLDYEAVESIEVLRDNKFYDLLKKKSIKLTISNRIL
jgi:hypothetical protein